MKPKELTFEAFEARINQALFFGQRPTFIVALSGGPDSMALLTLLKRYRDHHPETSLIAAHFNHKLRPEADKEEEILKLILSSLKVEFRRESADIRRLAREKGRSEHDMGRELRYDFLCRVAEECRELNPGNDPFIVTAHHLDDQVETVLMRLFSGSGAKAMGGIRPTSHRLWKGRCNRLFRPLLDFTKEQILDFCGKSKVECFHDTTNDETDLPRNKLRHEVIPNLCEKLGDSIKQSIVRTADNLDAAGELLELETTEKLSYCVKQSSDMEIALDYDKYFAYFYWIRCNCIRRIFNLLKDENSRITQERCVAAERFISGRKKGSLELGGGVSICVHRQTIWFFRNPPQIDPVKLEPLGRVEINGWGVLQTREISPDQCVFPPPPGCLYLDYELLNWSETTVKQAEPGDRFRTLGMKGSRKVSDLLSEKGAPPHRRKYPVIWSEDRIIAIPPINIGEAMKITENSRRVLEIQWHYR